MKKALTGLGLFLALVLVVGLAYAAGISYYGDRFLANTKIAKVDVSNLSLEQAQAKVKSEILEHSLDVLENGKALGTVHLKDLEPEFSGEATIQQYFNHQNPNSWLGHFFKGQDFDLSVMTDVKIDRNQVTSKLAELGVDNSKRTPSKDAQISYQEDQGYRLESQEQGNQVDISALREALFEQFEEGHNKLDLKDYYAKPEVTDQNEELQSMMQKIEDASKAKITLKIEDSKETIPKDAIQDWIYFDKDNKIIYDQEKIAEYLKRYNDKYSSYVNPRQFRSTNQGIVTVQPGTLGWSIDRAAEAEQIAIDLAAGKDVEREPIVVGSGYGSAGDGIGSTYVEVDLSYQMMYVYIDGKMVISTPIVSGGPQSQTIPGAYAVWGKQRDTSLKGYNWVTKKEYSSPVSYWMPFDHVGQGIHDAPWQPAFGGNLWQTNGSLGCINTPTNVMAQIFDIVEIGTPVIIFW